MAEQKKHLKKIIVPAACAAVLAAGSIGVLSLDAVQKSIAVAVLKNAGIEATFGEWDSHFFSELALRDVTLSRAGDFRVHVPQARIACNAFAWLFGAEYSLEAELPQAFSLQVAGSDFEVSAEEIVFGNAAGKTNRIAGELVSLKEGKRRPFRFALESENRETVSENSVYAWLAGTKTLRLYFNGTECRLQESGAWEIFDSEKRAFPPVVGAGTLNGGTLSGKISVNLRGNDLADFGVPENLPPWGASAEFDVNGDLAAGSYSLRHQFRITLENPAGTFSGVPLLPNIALSGQGELSFSREAFALKTLSAEMETVSENAPHAVFAEISVPGELRFAYVPNRKFEVSAAGSSDELALLKFNNIPLALANPFIGRIRNSGKESGWHLAGTLDGVFALVQDADGEFRFAEKEMLKVRDFSLGRAGETLFGGLFADVPFVAFTRGDSVVFEVKNTKLFGKDGKTLALADFAGRRDFAERKTAVESDIRINGKLFSREFSGALSQSLSPEEIAAEAKFKLEISDDAIEVDKFVLSVFEPGNPSQLLLFADTEAFRFDAGNPFVGLDGKRIRLRANNFPVSLLDPLAGGKFSFSGRIDGEITFVGDRDMLEFSAEERGMTIRNFGMKNGRALPLLRDLSLRSVENLVRVSCDASGTFRTEIGLKNARLKSGKNERLAAGDLYLDFIGRELLTLRGNISGELGGICSQPILSPVGNVAGGAFEMSGGWDAENRFAKLEINCRDLSSRDASPVELDGFFLKIEHNASSDVTEPARVQFTLEGIGRSEADIRFSKLEINRREDKITFNANAVSEKIVTEDFVSLAKIFSPEKTVIPVLVAESVRTSVGKEAKGNAQSQNEKAALPASSKREAVAKTPSHRKADGTSAALPAERTEGKSVSADRGRATLPWKNLAGILRYEIREWIVSGSAIQNLRGSLSLSPERGEFLAGSDDFFGGKLKSKTVLETRKNASTVYLKSKVEVADSRIRELIPALRGKDPSVLEGIFSLDLTAESEASGTDDLPKHIAAKATLTGRDGNIRIFAVGNKKVRSIGRLAEIGGTVADVFGKFGGKRVRKLTRAASRLQEYLSSFPFDENEVRLSYKAGAPIRCEKFLLKNDSLKILADGEIDYSEGRPLEKSPIEIRARMDVRGELEEWMRVLGLLKSGEPLADADGRTYTAGPEFKFSGTFDKISDEFLENLLPEGLNIKF